MPQINRIRVNNVKYNFGTQMYDDFILRPFGRNMLYDLANGGGKSVLMLLMLQTIIPNCTLDEKQPVEKLFRTGDGSQTIHSLMEWKLDPAGIKSGLKFMTAGFCARKSSQDGKEGEEAKDTASIEYFNYCIFYRDYNENDIRNLPLIKDGEKITYNGLRKYLKDLEKDPSLEVLMFDRKGEYQKFLSGYGIYESTWELIRGINKTEGHVRTYFETNYKTTRKVVEDLLIEEIIQKSFLMKTDGADAEDSMARTLLDMKDQLAELARRKEEISRFDRQAELLGRFAEQMGGFKELYQNKSELETELTKTYEGAKYFYESRMRDCEMRKQGLAALAEEIRAFSAKLACAALCGDKNRAAQMVLEIEMLAGSLETVKNRQAKENFSLQMKESMNDYLEYQEEKKKRDEVAETIRAMQDKSTDLIGELKLLTWHMKKRMDLRRVRVRKELARFEAELENSRALLKDYDGAFRHLERGQAVAESRTEDLKAERKERLAKMAVCKGDAGVLVAEEAENAAEKRKAELEEGRKEKERLIGEAEALLRERAEAEAALTGLSAKREELAKELKDWEEFERNYRDKRNHVMKFLRIYKKGTLEEVLAELRLKEREALREELRLSAEKEKLEAGLADLLSGKWPSAGGVQDQLKEYAKENWKEELLTGAEYLLGKEESEREELISRYPFLPCALVAGGGYDKLASDPAVREKEWMKGCVPIIREELIDRGEDLCHKGRMFLLTGEAAVFLDAGRLEEEIKRREEEAGKLEEALRRLAERRETCASDASGIQEFLLHWEKEYAVKNERAMAFEVLSAETEVKYLETGELRERLLTRDAQMKEMLSGLEEELVRKETSLRACLTLAEEYKKLLETENLLSEEEAEYKRISAELNALEEKRSSCGEKAKELASLCTARKDLLSSMDRDWEEKYSAYYEDGNYKEIRLTDDELEAKLNGRRTAALQENSELEDKNRLVNSYISAMNRCLRSITARGISVADLTERQERNELYATKEEELTELRKLLNSLAKEIQSKEKALELLRADWNRLDGRNQQAAEEIKKTYGVYEEMELSAEEAEAYISDLERLIDRKKSEENGAKLGLEAALSEIRDYEDVKKDIERMFKNTGIALDYGGEKVAENVNLREHFKEVENQYDRLLKKLAKEQENFYGRKEKLTKDLEELSAEPLAEEIRTSVRMPANTLEIERMLTGLSEIVECLFLEKDRVESSIAELTSMKENFESQCLQRCMNIRTELERLPKLSKIMLDGNLIPIISLTVPYVKEEFFKERMSAYIDEVVRGADGAENERDRLKYIRSALAWKKLFSVIVTDMNAVRLLLYKRERVKEQSRHLRYEEAVGSTGQSQGIYIQFLIAVINYIASINSTETESADLTKVLFIDNPFGAAKDVYIWEPIFELLRTNRVQLIVPARGTTPAITGRFDVNYVLGQKLVDGKQLTVVADYVSRVDTGEMEYVPLKYEQTSLDIF